MFRQAKKARSLMDDYQTVDHFDLLQLFIVAVFTIVLVGIWYYSKKADIAIENNTNVNNPIIKDLQIKPKVEEVISDYGNVENLDSNKVENE